MQQQSQMFRNSTKILVSEEAKESLRNMILNITKMLAIESWSRLRLEIGRRGGNLDNH